MNEPVRCLRNESAVHVIVPSGPTVVFDGAQRSSLLVHMACAEGPFSLPVSQRGLNLLKEAEASMEKGTSWVCRRFSDLGRVAEVNHQSYFTLLKLSLIHISEPTRPY